MQLPKALYLKALWPLSNRYSNRLNHRYSSQHVQSSLTVKRLLLLSNLYSSLNSQCNSRLPLLKALCLKALLPLSNRYSNRLNHRYNSQRVLS